MGFDFPAIDPVAFSIGPLAVRWYALAYLAGFLLGWRYALYLAGLDKHRPSREDIDDLLPWTVLGVIVGGRLGYVLFYQPEFYLANPAEILMVWHGGMAFHGGVLGVVTALVGFALVRKINVLRLADILCAAVPIGLFFGRIANFVNGELYGRVATDLPWAVRFPRGGDLPRHPSQLYQALLEGAAIFTVLLALSLWKKGREMPGLRAGVFLVLYALFRSFAELYREPDAQIGYIMGWLTMGQILSAPMLLGGLALIAISWLRRPVASRASSGASS